MMPNIPARLFRRLCLFPHFKGKSHLEQLIEPWIPLLPPPEEGVALPWGVTMKLNPRSPFERSCYFRNGEPDTFDLLTDMLRPGDIFADCGANLGIFTLRAAQIVGAGGRVHAFEPTPATFERLRAHVDLNHFTNVTAWRVALGDAEGRAAVYQPSSSHHGMNFIDSAPADGEATDVGDCEVVSLDAMISSGRIEPPMFMKIDVEGSELRLLQGARELLASPHPPTMLIELSRGTTSRFGYAPEDIIAFIRSQARHYSIEWPFLGRRRPVDTALSLPHYAILGLNPGANYLFTPQTRTR